MVPAEPISTLVFYLFSPALVFESLAQTDLPAGDVAGIVTVHVVVFLGIYGITAVWSTVAHHSQPLRAALALVATIPNSGNIGLPISLLAFGQVGLDIAVVFFIVSTILAATFGVVIASLSSGFSFRVSSSPFRFPILYGAAFGLLVNVLDIDLAPIVQVPMSALADATIPTMLVVLGLQLRGSFRSEELGDTLGAVTLRLIGSPILALATTSLLGISGVSQSILIVLASTPTGIITTILATEFDAKPAVVSSGVFVSTIVSVATLTVLIKLVQ